MGGTLKKGLRYGHNLKREILGTGTSLRGGGGVLGTGTTLHKGRLKNWSCKKRGFQKLMLHKRGFLGAYLLITYTFLVNMINWWGVSSSDILCTGQARRGGGV